MSDINDDWDLRNYELVSDEHGFKIYVRVKGQGPAGWNWMMVSPWGSKCLGHSRQHLENHKLLQERNHD